MSRVKYSKTLSKTSPEWEKERKQRSGIDTIKHHTWPRTLYGKVSKTQENNDDFGKADDIGTLYVVYVLMA